MKFRPAILVMVMAAALLTGASAMAADIGLAWVGKSGMADRVLAGFQQGVQDMSLDLNIEYQKELATLDDLSKVVERWQKEKKGMVILRSNGAEWLGKNPPSIPTFIGGCNHPVTLGTLKNIEAPEGNVTGVTYFLPTDTQFEVFKAIIPNLSSILLLLAEGNPSSGVDREETKAVCAKLGIAYSEKLCTTPDEAIAAVKEHQGKVSAVIIGSQALHIDNAENIVTAAGKTPVLSYSDKPVKAGALGGFVADDNKMGMILAGSVADVLLNGKAVKDVPVKMDPDPKFFVNAKTAEKLGLEIPFNILEMASVIE